MQSLREPSEHQEHPIELPTAPNPTPRTMRRVVVTLVVLFGVALAAGLVPKLHQRAALESETAARMNAAPRVLVAHPRPADASSELSLPASVDALRSTVIYARTNGYLKQRLVDIGDTVKEGQLLAVIETPEVDQELDQARSNLEQSKATQAQATTDLEFARISLERARELAKPGVVSQQDFDQRTAQHQAEEAKLRAAAASIAANQANVRRLTDLKSFARVLAPFAGTITERDVEVGALITPGNGSGQALFKLAATNPARVFVSVPQSLAQSVQVGAKATVTVRERQGRKFEGKVTRDAHALDERSRTLLTEVQVPNDDGALWPGMYAQVAFHVVQPRPAVIVDGSALLAGADGPTVAVVGADGHVQLRRVTIEVDYGATIAVSEGLTTADRVILNADGSLKDGLAVDATESAPAAPAKH